MLNIYKKRCSLVIEGLKHCPIIKIIEPDAGMFVLLDIRALNVSSKAFALALYKHGKVSTLDATAFGACAKGFIRLSFTLDNAQLEAACVRIKQFVTDVIENKIAIEKLIPNNSKANQEK